MNKSVMRARLLALLGGAIGLSAAGEGRAEGGKQTSLPSGILHLNPGYLFTKDNGTFPHGHGAEVSLNWFPDSRVEENFGLFGQAQSFGGTPRYAGGLQAAYGMWGAELGMAHRGGTDALAPTTSAHLGLFASLVFVGLGYRWDIPIAHSGPLPDHGIDGGFFVTVKLPICVLQSSYEAHFFRGLFCSYNVPGLGSGRPLRVEQRVRVAPLQRRDGWGEQGMSDEAALRR